MTLLLNPLELDEKEFNLLRELIYQESGINLSETKKALVRARLTKRIKALKLNSFEGYYTYLKNNYDIEKVNFINAITTNKTDFFREPKHFEHIKEIVLPDLEQQGKREIKIWSAGCSSGEEPYTLAITLHEYFKNTMGSTFKILATDIDTQMLDKARNGVYTHEQVEGINKIILSKYFLRGKGKNKDSFMTKDILKNVIRFRKLNLQDAVYPMKGQFDIIFCRNVIIYFNKETQKILFKKFYKHLEDSGYLFIGHSENISILTNDFNLVGNTMYTKAL